MKVFLDVGERYPVYSMSREKWYVDLEVEIDQELVDRIDAAVSEYEECQDILSELYHAAKEARKKK